MNDVHMLHLRTKSVPCAVGLKVIGLTVEFAVNGLILDATSDLDLEHSR
jgi:hypothetical protein